MTESALLTAIFQNDYPPYDTLRELRKQAAFQATIVRRHSNGRIAVEWFGPLMPLGGALSGGVAGAALGGALGFPALAGLAAVTGAVLGWLLVGRANRRVAAAIGKYRRWLLPGESLLVLAVPVDCAIGMLKQLKQVSRRHPVSLSINPALAPAPYRQEAAPRQEPLSQERLRRQAVRLAAEHRVIAARGNRSLLDKIVPNRLTIDLVRQDLELMAELGRGLTAGAEWLLDNAYLIEGQIGEVRRNLPRPYYEELPVVVGQGGVIPRIYSLAEVLIDGTDARFDREAIVGYLHAYQAATPLTIGETWALPLILRLALIERLRRLCLRVHFRQCQHEQADFWAERLQQAAKNEPDLLLFLLAELAREHRRPAHYFAVRLLGLLHDEPAASAPLRDWLERKLGLTIAEASQEERNAQTADQVSMANTVNSLRQLAQIEWRLVFEEINPVEAILRQDPAGIYPETDFVTRDNCRHAVEEIARRSAAAETGVAAAAVDMAAAAGGESLEGHVGFWLLDQGRERLEAEFAYRPALPVALRRWIRARPAAVYLGALLAAALIILAIPLVLAVRAGAGTGFLVFVALAAVFPAGEIAIQTVNFILSKMFPPTVLPKMAYEHGIPDDVRTLVIVPMMLHSRAALAAEIERLEVRYLANPEANLLFGLLADFVDAPVPETPADHDLTQAALAAVEELNRRHGDGRFFFFLRSRQWSVSEQAYIGWERKRGKLEMLNRFLLEGAAPDEPDFLRVGRPEDLRGVKYVITLDSDTQLPRGSARRLIETAAHPLNRVRLSADGRSAARGYTIIQPRVSTSLPSATATSFTRLFSDPAGQDPYAHAVSDVYQDLAGRGTFYGKGLYDVAAFHQMLAGRFPEAAILSHDLLEGAYVGVGLASDIELLDSFPLNYQAFIRRQHRWHRGDWQIAAWAGPRVPSSGGGRAANPLSALDRWKIADNLRRSLTAPASFLALLTAWFGAAAPGVWSGFIGLGLCFPTVLQLLDQPRLCLSGNKQTWQGIGRSLLRNLVNAAFLPYQAWMALDAVARTGYRCLFSRRRLLEWETAQQSGALSRDRDRVRAFFWRMSAIGLGGAGLGAAMLGRTPASAIAAAPYLLLWLSAPLAARRLSGTAEPPPLPGLSGNDRVFLRRAARLTWHFFDKFTGPDGEWLPPDNYQEGEYEEVAWRTSPTNIGMWLLSALTAYDLGYLTAPDLAARTAATVRTVARLETYEGHLFNWYDLRTLEPLRPRYISTVDSGNLLAAFWTYTQGLREAAETPLVGGAALAGLVDTAGILGDSVPPDCLNGLTGIVSALTNLWREPAAEPIGLYRRLRAGAELTRDLAGLLAAVEAGEAVQWAGILAGAVKNWVGLLDDYLAWAERLAAPPPGALSVLRGETGEAWRRLLGAVPSLSGLAAGEEQLAALMRTIVDAADRKADVVEWADAILAEAAAARKRARVRLDEIDDTLAAVERLAAGMNMRLLYRKDRRLFSVGFNVHDGRLDSSSYDLLASEARLASFTAIAKGEVPIEHWLALGRPYGLIDGRAVLLSWNGTMFEYLMPLLLMRSFDHSQLDAAVREAVAVQIAYGERHGLPWGISEAGFNMFDTHGTYQYQAFGVPGLGLKRGLEQDLVVAPYSTALALAVDPNAAAANLARLAAAGYMGRYGFYESIDFTPARDSGGRGTIVRAFMAHHQGMTMTALGNALNGGRMQARFHADPRVKATENLLYGRIPLQPELVMPTGGREARTARTVTDAPAPAGAFNTPHTALPKTLLLANSAMVSMVTNAGGSYLRWAGLDITRWRADTTRDSWGSFIYLRDLEEDAAWSFAYHPLARAGRRYRAVFSPDRAEFSRRDFGLETVTEITVAPDDDVEIRRLTLINRSSRPRRLEITSYAELALAPHAADRAHPAFAKMFVETEALPDHRALLARRRPRGADDQPCWAGQVLGCDKPLLEPAAFETDRARFLGRGRGPADAEALRQPLGNTAGTVLDPIFSLRGRVEVPAGGRIKLYFTTAAAPERERLLVLVDKYRNPGEAEAAFEAASTRAQFELRYLGITQDEARNYQELGGRLIFPSGHPQTGRQRRSTLPLQALWAHGISGDLPIVAVTIDDARWLPRVREILTAQTYLQNRGLYFDLVIINGEDAHYHQALQEELKRLAAAQDLLGGGGRRGGVFLQTANQMAEEEILLILAAARVVLAASRMTLAQQLRAAALINDLPPRLTKAHREPEERAIPLPFMELPYFNGLGGFTPDGREYAIYLGPGGRTPAPWVNVMANPGFGALVSESGAGFVWRGNSQTGRLLPWANDPVTDPAHDALYIRDEETGIYWTPAPAPVRDREAYRVRHGQGYTVFEHNSRGLEQEMTIFVPMDAEGGAPLRLQRLRLINRSGRRRRLSVFAYAEWTPGGEREDTQAHVATRYDEESRALLARNSFDPGSERIVFAAFNAPAASYTADRAEFLGRNGSPAAPAALGRRRLSGRTGADFDTCAALQAELMMEPGQTAEVVFLFGQGEDLIRVRRLIDGYRTSFQVEEALAATKAFWDRLLGAVRVETPDLAVNFLLNRWLLYQVLSCRIWARSALYQSGGAYGFRDQLQDVTALLHTRAEEAREHILRAAGRQFVEGDVQHWWHPETGVGTRTRIADDPLWLVQAVLRYVEITGDQDILDAPVSFLDGRQLQEEEREACLQPTPAMEDGSLFEHCRRALAATASLGPRGLPLIKTGDWNDGMNRVGPAGRGESVWLAWFRLDALNGFADLCDRRGDADLAAACRAEARRLAVVLDDEAWDGGWYRRAYFDDGTPIGAAGQEEAAIDSLPQSWAVLAGGGDPARAGAAVTAALERLVRWDDRMALLFTPPFTGRGRDPGYLAAYPPGVRENGGQYTHAALWLAMAVARLGDGDRAVALMRLLNPVEHTRTLSEVERYRVEPYVAAADISAAPGRIGQGGWTWYTGAAGWMYRVWLEEILGCRRRADRLRLEPVIPRDWPEFKIEYTYGTSVYEIVVLNPDRINRGVTLVEMDGFPLPDGEIPLTDDGRRHEVRVRMGIAEREPEMVR